MDEPHVDQPGQTAYLASGATADGESVGPVFVRAGEAHVIARTSIVGLGGTVRILRAVAGGWVEVARYTDTGRQPTSTAVDPHWVAVAAG